MSDFENRVNSLLSEWKSTFGLNQWDIQWEFADDEEQETMASIWCVPNTRSALLKLNREWGERDDLESVIVHELVHALISPISRSIDVVFDNHNLSNDTIDLYNNVEEQVIDKITKAFLSMRSTKCLIISQ